MTALGQTVGKSLTVLDDLLGICLELGLHRLFEADRLGCDDVHERTALHTGEQRLVDSLGELLAAEDQTASGTAEGLVSGGGDELGIGHGVLMHAACYQTGDMSHIHHQISADLIADLAELLEVDSARISGSAADDHLRLALLCDLEHLIVVDAMCNGIYTVADEVEVLTAEVDGRTVGQMTALAEAHAHDGIAGVEHSEVYDLVSLRAGVGLDVGVLGAEQLARTLARDILGDIHGVAAAVVALAGIALGILVCEHGAHSRHNCGRNDVLAGDQLEIMLLALELQSHRVADLFIVILYETDRIH